MNATEHYEPASELELLVRYEGPVLHLTLNRIARRNALSRSLVSHLRQAIDSATVHHTTRVIVIGGTGPSFCAGGDISQFAVEPDETTARADARNLIDLYGAMAHCPLPIVARAHGPIFGGGVGLVCAADIAVASDEARFSLSEARLGIVPGVVGPYVIAALGSREAKARMLMAAPFDAAEALRIGLVHRCVPLGELNAAVEAVVDDLLMCAPGSLAIIKRIPDLVANTAPDAIDDATASLFAERMMSGEGREGLRAFLEKRPAAWVRKRDHQ